MALIDYATLTEPIDGAAPCGPDLDLEGDLDFMSYVARAEGLLPQLYIALHPKEGFGYVPFDRLPDHTAIAYGDEIQTIAGFLSRSRDLRLLTLVAKFLILSRDLSGFARAVAAIGRLLSERWESVHPGADGDFSLRSVVLETLDDAATVVQPLQHAPLVASRRFGTISYRNIMVARGEATAREGEEVPDDSTIEDAFDKVDFGELVQRRDEIKGIKEALTLIRATWLDKAGYGQAISFPKLSAAVDSILRTVDDAVGRRDPAARLSDAAPPAADGAAAAGAAPAVPSGTASAGRVGSVGEAASALAAAAAYYAAREPSSPALLLVRQAQHLMGKSFHEVIEALLPNHAEQASIRFGVDAVFDLPIQRLSGFNGADLAGPADEDPEDGIEPPAEDMAEAEAEAEAEESPEEAAGESVAEEAGAAAPNPVAKLAPNGAGLPIPRAKTRQEAVAMLEQVGAFYRAERAGEPNSSFHGSSVRSVTEGFPDIA